MAVICPTVTAYNLHQYRTQTERLLPFAKRIHIDLMDGRLAPTESPRLDEIWLPHETINDVHLMYRQPMPDIDRLLMLKPSLVVIHFEADVDHMDFAARLHQHGIDAGLALLQDTSPEQAYRAMHSFDHILIFSGDLGHHGGKANLSLLDKVGYVRKHHPEVEIGWDGGVNADNARELVRAGIDVLNVGGFIQNADDPAAAYAKINNIIRG